MDDSGYEYSIYIFNYSKGTIICQNLRTYKKIHKVLTINATTEFYKNLIIKIPPTAYLLPY